MEDTCFQNIGSIQNIGGLPVRFCKPYTKLVNRRWRPPHCNSDDVSSKTDADVSLASAMPPSLMLPRQRALPPLDGVHQVGDEVAGKYVIKKVLGQGGMGTTFEAVTADGESVALKVLSLRGMKGWKELDLFEREARVLRSLKHPSIAEYIDHFEVDTGTDRWFYLVQKVAQGQSLADLVSSGWRVTEAEVVKIALQVLEVLRYLESLRPPVVHRDIKPENIILDKETGKVKVVDFGAVQEAAATTFLGSTVVGTYGYMAPEQFQNRAGPQSDLYALGCTILFLLSGRPPSSFPQKRLRVDFRGAVTVSEPLALVLEQLLEPAVEDRFQSAGQVIEALQGTPRVPINGGQLRVQKSFGQLKENRRMGRPSGTKVMVEKSYNELLITIPPSGLTAETIGSGTFAVAWTSFVGFWTASAITAGAPLLFSAFSIPFWVVGAGLLRQVGSNIAVSVNVKIQRNGKFNMEWKLRSLWSHTEEGRTENISSARVIATGSENDRQVTVCEILEGVKSHLFGGGLHLVEKEWLVSEITDFLQLPYQPFKPVERARRLDNSESGWWD